MRKSQPEAFSDGVIRRAHSASAKIPWLIPDRHIKEKVGAKEN